MSLDSFIFSGFVYMSDSMNLSKISMSMLLCRAAGYKKDHKLLGQCHKISAFPKISKEYKNNGEYSPCLKPQLLKMKKRLDTGNGGHIGECLTELFHTLLFYLCK